MVRVAAGVVAAQAAPWLRTSSWVMILRCATVASWSRVMLVYSRMHTSAYAASGSSERGRPPAWLATSPLASAAESRRVAICASGELEGSGGERGSASLGVAGVPGDASPERSSEAASTDAWRRGGLPSRAALGGAGMSTTNELFVSLLGGHTGREALPRLPQPWLLPLLPSRPLPRPPAGRCSRVGSSPQRCTGRKVTRRVPTAEVREARGPALILASSVDTRSVAADAREADARPSPPRPSPPRPSPPRPSTTWLTRLSIERLESVLPDDVFTDESCETRRAAFSNCMRSTDACSSCSAVAAASSASLHVAAAAAAAAAVVVIVPRAAAVPGLASSPPPDSLPHLRARSCRLSSMSMSATSGVSRRWKRFCRCARLVRFTQSMHHHVRRQRASTPADAAHVMIVSVGGPPADIASRGCRGGTGGAGGGARGGGSGGNEGLGLGAVGGDGGRGGARGWKQGGEGGGGDGCGGRGDG